MEEEKLIKETDEIFVRKASYQKIVYRIAEECAVVKELMEVALELGGVFVSSPGTLKDIQPNTDCIGDLGYDILTIFCNSMEERTSIIRTLADRVENRCIKLQMIYFIDLRVEGNKVVEWTKE